MEEISSILCQRTLDERDRGVRSRVTPNARTESNDSRSIRHYAHNSRSSDGADERDTLLALYDSHPKDHSNQFDFADCRVSGDVATKGGRTRIQPSGRMGSLVQLAEKTLLRSVSSLGKSNFGNRGNGVFRSNDRQVRGNEVEWFRNLAATWRSTRLQWRLNTRGPCHHSLILTPAVNRIRSALGAAVNSHAWLQQFMNKDALLLVVTLPIPLFAPLS